MNKLKINETPIIYYISLFITFLFSFLMLFIFEEGEKSDAYIILSFVVPQLGNALALYGYSRYRKLDLKDTITVSKPKVSGLAICVVITIALFIQNLLIVAVANEFLEFINFSGAVGLPNFDKPINVMWGILTICVMPAIFEELIFRGVFVGTLKNINQTFAIVVSALIFSLMHFNLVQVVHQFIVGIVLAYIYIKTKNLTYTIVIHFLNNFIAIMIPIVSGRDIVISGYWYILAAGLAIIGFVVLIQGLKLLCGKNNFRIEKDKNFWKNLKDNPNIAILLLFLLLMSIVSAVAMF